MKKEVKMEKNVKSKKTKPIINLKDAVKFFNENLKKKTLILFIIFLVISAVLLVPFVNEFKKVLSNGVELEFSIVDFIKSKIFFLTITAVSSVVPYLYIPVMGGLGYIYESLADYAYIIVDKGYILGFLIIIIPFILNLICISITSALGIYLCKINTNKFSLGQHRNMNFTRFRLEFAKVVGNKEKENKIQKKIDEKEEKIQSKETKIKYKEVLIIFGITYILQLISSLIEGLFI